MALNTAELRLLAASPPGANHSNLCSYIACCSMCGLVDDTGIEASQVMMSQVHPEQALSCIL